MTASHPTTSTDADLRVVRRERVFDAMAVAGLDVLVLGRRDAVAYATGASSLWTAATRPFGAACVLFAADRSTHLLSTWDAGVPPEISFEQLYGITWNPATMAASLSAMPGLPEASRIGVDALSPGFERAAHRLAPGAELIPADDLLRAVRAAKLPGEIACIRDAAAVARIGVEAARAVVITGGTPEGARAAAVRAVAGRGTTVPSSGIVVGASAGHGSARPTRSFTASPAAPVVDGVAARGRSVHIDVGVLVDGFEGGLGRTVDRATGGEDPGAAAVVTAQRRLLDACRPRATADVLRAAGGTARWMVRGSGMGFEPPVVTSRLGKEVLIERDMVLSVEVTLDGWRRRDLALVGARATEVL